jgi:2-octaprenyl-6-methoxyphenol hydroxylase
MPERLIAAAGRRKRGARETAAIGGSAMNTARPGPALAVDAAVVGAGPAGATAALALAAEGLSVALVGPAPAADPRTTALLAGSIGLLDRLAVWPRVSHAAAPLRVMRLVDDTGRLIRAPEVAFDAAELGLEAFGWNIPNDALNAGLAAALAETSVMRITAPAADIVPGEAHVSIGAGGREIRARLAVAADGAASPTREAAGIPVRRWRYPQTAFVTTLRHELPHRGVSTEFHTPTGPFTLVPLPGDRSSLVWIERPAEAERLAALDDAALSRAIERKAHSILGAMTVDGPRGLLPLEGHVAQRFAERRVALVGEAAHRFPPIGAQGLNLGLRDVAALAGAVRAAPDAGAAEVLARYDRARRLDVTTRTAGVDLLDRSLLSGFLPVQLARGLGLWAAGRFPPIRRLMMRQGLGADVAAGPVRRAG